MSINTIFEKIHSLGKFLENFSSEFKNEYDRLYKFTNCNSNKILSALKRFLNKSDGEVSKAFCYLMQAQNYLSRKVLTELGIPDEKIPENFSIEKDYENFPVEYQKKIQKWVDDLKLQHLSGVSYVNRPMAFIPTPTEPTPPNIHTSATSSGGLRHSGRVAIGISPFINNNPHPNRGPSAQAKPPPRPVNSRVNNDRVRSIAELKAILGE